MKRVVLVLSIVLLAACVTHRQQQRSSNLLSYLYPHADALPAPQHPELPVPLRVGIAFVPAATGSRIDDVQQALVLHKIRQRFEQEQGIAKVVIIPSAYLERKGGFDHIAQLAQLYHIDVITLISYEQLAQASDRKSSFLYWTIVGAYGVNGTRNDVQTYLDAAVFDIRSRSLLFRADGLDVRSSNSTMVEAERTQSALFEHSLGAAADNLSDNLHAALQLFKDEIKSEQIATVKPRRPALDRSGGAGSLSVDLLVLIAIIWAGKRLLALCDKLPNQPR